MLFIFDWDGTISDSASKIISCMQSTAKEMGLEPRTESEIKNNIGLALPIAMRKLYPEISEDALERLQTGYSAHFLSSDAKPSPLFPGARETLESLKSAGHTLAVATSKSRRGLDRVLDLLGMSEFFHGSRCADETASKPDPLMLRQLVDEFSIDVENAVMVGDTEYDLEMAQQFGMARIAVTYGAHHVDRLVQYEPVLCVDEFPQILDWSNSQV